MFRVLVQLINANLTSKNIELITNKSSCKTQDLDKRDPGKIL